jgi:hypothetical protein
MPDALGRAYRRLLRFYPRGPRRNELLVTLLDAAPADRRWPTARETVDLIRHGLRARLGYRRSAAVVVFSLLVALTGAYFGAAAADRAGLEFAPGPPTGADAAAITGTVFPGLKVWGGGDTEPIVEQGDGEGIEYGFVTYWVRHTTAATRDIPGYAIAARDRLVADGWQVHDYRYEAPEALVDGGQSSGATFWASRDDVVLGYEGWLYTGMPSYDSDGGAHLTLRRQPPSWLPAFAWPGAVIGALLTWFLAAWVSRRLDTAGVPGALLGMVAGFTLFLVLPGMVTEAVPDSPGETPWWGGSFGDGTALAPFAAVPAVLLLLAAFLLGPNPLIDAARRGIAWLRRRPRITVAGVSVVALTAVVVLVVPASSPLVSSACRPAPGPPPAAPESETRDSRRAHVYVSASATPDERNLIDAAIRRSYAAAGSTLVWEPGSAEFRSTYCDGGPVESQAVAGLPYFFAVDLDVATDYPALLQEVRGMPGVVAVRQAPDRT